MNTSEKDNVPALRGGDSRGNDRAASAPPACCRAPWSRTDEPHGDHHGGDGRAGSSGWPVGVPL